MAWTRLRPRGCLRARARQSSLCGRTGSPQGWICGEPEAREGVDLGRVVRNERSPFGPHRSWRWPLRGGAATDEQQAGSPAGILSQQETLGESSTLPGPNWPEVRKGRCPACQNLFRLCFSASQLRRSRVHLLCLLPPSTCWPRTPLTCSVPLLHLKLTSFLLFQPVKLLAASGPLQSVLPPSGTFCLLDSHGWCLIRCLSSNFTS